MNRLALLALPFVACSTDIPLGTLKSCRQEALVHACNAPSAPASIDWGQCLANGSCACLDGAELDEQGRCGPSSACDGGLCANLAPTCTPGRDQECNEDPLMSALSGWCGAAGTCTCSAGFEVGPQGKCRSNRAEGECLSLGLLNPGNLVQPSASGCLCSRRDLVPVGTCPRGVGESASATIGPAGGVVMLMGQQGIASGVPFTITFPPTAIATPTLITVTETTLLPPPGSVDWSPVYRIDPVGLVLAAPATLKVPWSQGPIWGAPTLFWSGASTCMLERLPSSYSNAGFNQGNVGRLGYAMSGYAEIGQAPMCQ
ncbi:MAG: hypothetical protein Q8L48_17100 [Archangium sp.]|nr:hypothetical protein [Archangium sp.]